MTLMATSQVSLLTGLNSAKNQSALSPNMVGGASTFLQVLNNTTSEHTSQTDFDGLVTNAKSALETVVPDLDGASMTPLNTIDDASKENPAAPVVDAVWLAHWFQNNAPTIASSPAHSLGSATDPVEPARIETAIKPLAMLSSSPVAPTDVSISDHSIQSPWVLSDKPVYAGSHPPAAALSKTAASLSLPISSAVQAPSQPASPSASNGLGSLVDYKSCQNLPNASGHLNPRDVLFKLPMDIGGSVKLSQSVGSNDAKDFDHGRWLPLMPGSGQLRLDPPVGQNLQHHLVGQEAALPSLGPDAPGTLNLVEAAWIETAPKPLLALSSEPISRKDVPVSDKAQHIPWVLSDKPVNAGGVAPAATPSNAAVSSPLSTSSAIQATSQPASIEVVILNKKTPKNLSFDSDRMKSTEVLSKVPTDIVGSVAWGQSVESKGIKDFESDRWLPVMPSSVQVGLEQHAGQNLPSQIVSSEAAQPGFSPDAQWTSNLADTVNQWVEKSLQLAELMVPDAGQDSLQVRIELNGQEATVYFLTDHDQYRAAIESQIENLSDRLADQGLKLAGSFVGQGSSQNSHQQQSAHSMLSRRHVNEPDSSKVMPVDPVLGERKTVHQGQVLDVFA